MENKRANDERLAKALGALVTELAGVIDDLLPPAERRRIAAWLAAGRSFEVTLNFHQQRLSCSADYRLHVELRGRRRPDARSRAETKKRTEVLK